MMLHLYRVRVPRGRTVHLAPSLDPADEALCGHTTKYGKDWILESHTSYRPLCEGCSRVHAESGHSALISGDDGGGEAP